MTEKIIIIGGGQAAVSFIAKFIKTVSDDFDGSVTLVCEEPDLPYQRPPLSKKYATGDMTREQLSLRTEAWYGENGITYMLGTRVTEVSTENKTISLEDGSSLEWTKLLFATGSRARELPNALTSDLDGVHTFRTLADADRFATLLQPGQRALIIGGGYIGLEAAAVCAAKGLEVTLVEAADRILQRVACPETSAWFKRKHESQGVTVVEGVGIDALEGKDGAVSQARLSNGDVIDTDFVIAGIGIIPNAELASDAGLTVEGGIVVNEHCQTTHPDIFAAGDCAAFRYKDELTRLESVQNAIDQADCAALNMLGQATEYTPYPWFWSDQYDVKLQIAGLNRGYDQVVVRESQTEGSVSHFYFKEGQFIAVDAINDPRTYMIGKRMLENGKTLSPEQAQDTSIELKGLMR